MSLKEFDWDKFIDHSRICVYCSTREYADLFIKAMDNTPMSGQWYWRADLEPKVGCYTGDCKYLTLGEAKEAGFEILYYEHYFPLKETVQKVQELEDVNLQEGDYFTLGDNQLVNQVVDTSSKEIKYVALYDMTRNLMSLPVGLLVTKLPKKPIYTVDDCLLKIGVVCGVYWDQEKHTFSYMYFQDGGYHNIDESYILSQSLSVGDFFRINRSMQVNEVVDIGSNGDVKFKALDSTESPVRILQESVTVYKLQGKPKFLPGDLVERIRVAYVVWDNDNDCYAYQSVSFCQIPIEEVKAKKYVCTKNTRNPSRLRYWLVSAVHTGLHWKLGKVYTTDSKGCGAINEVGTSYVNPIQENTELTVTEINPELFPRNIPLNTSGFLNVDPKCEDNITQGKVYILDNGYIIDDKGTKRDVINKCGRGIVNSYDMEKLQCLFSYEYTKGKTYPFVYKPNPACFIEDTEVKYTKGDIVVGDKSGVVYQIVSVTDDDLVIRNYESNECTTVAKNTGLQKIQKIPAVPDYSYRHLQGGYLRVVLTLFNTESQTFEYDVVITSEPIFLYDVGDVLIHDKISKEPLTVTSRFIKNGYIAYELTAEGLAPYVVNETSLKEESILIK